MELEYSCNLYYDRHVGSMKIKMCWLLKVQFSKGKKEWEEKKGGQESGQLLIS
jgi:hypothetical protein